MPPISSLSPRLTALSAALAAVGFTSTSAQLVLMRELVAVFYGNELVLGLVLAVWLAWVAVGAWGVSNVALPPSRLRAWGQGRKAMAGGLVLAAAILPGQVALVRASRSLLGVTPGALVPFGPMLLSIVLLLAPLCVLVGWQFALGARLFSEVLERPADNQERGQSNARVKGSGGAGRAYLAESLGAVAGGALFSFLLVRWLDPFQIVLGIGVMNLAIAAAMVRQAPAEGDGKGKRSKARSKIGAAFLVVGASVLAIASLPLGAWLHGTTLGWQYGDLRFAGDSIYGRTTVTGSGEQRVFYENGLLLFETQGVAAEEVAHLPLLAHPEPRRVLLVGGGVSGTLAEIFRHPSVQEVHYVELDPLIVEAARQELPPDQATALEDPRVTLVHQDGRLYLRSSLQKGKSFDVVVVDLPEPATGQLNRFYTAEFYAQVRAILAPGGLLALSLPWQENYPGPALQRLGASIQHTLAGEFRETVPIPGQRLFLLASNDSLMTDPATLSARLGERSLTTRWVVPSYLAYLLRDDRLAQARYLLETDERAQKNRDLEPISYFYDLSVWLSRFYGELERLVGAASILRLGWLSLALAIVVIVTRYRAFRARQRGASPCRVTVPIALGLVGLAQMTLQIVVLFAFQVIHGYVYGQVGLIVTAFMGGLALGSAVANRFRWPLQPSQRGLPTHNPQAAFVWILGSVALLSLGVLLLVYLSSPAWTFPVLALTAGGLTGLAFPVAAASMGDNEDPPGQRAGLLYGADLVGGCAGAILASVLLVPLLGIPETCLAVGLVGVAGLLILL